MKLSFSTFGWDGFTWDKLCRTAKECGFTGIEIHNIHEPVFSGYQNLFDPAQIRRHVPRRPACCAPGL
jgi:fatty-acyl-CoA synthase